MAKKAEIVFRKQKTVNRVESVSLVKKGFPAISYSENKFVCVKGDKSPYDNDITYWSQRNSKLYDGKTSQLLDKKHQNHTCAACGLKFLPGEDVHLHHKDENHNNWNDKNLEVIHRSCHQYKHVSKSTD